MEARKKKRTSSNNNGKHWSKMCYDHYYYFCETTLFFIIAATSYFGRLFIFTETSWLIQCILTKNWRRWECCSNFSFFSVWTFIRANNNNQYQRGWDGMRCDALCSLTWWQSMCVCLFSECENQMDICVYNSHAFGMGRIFVMRFHLICDMMSNFNLIWAPVSTVWLHLILPIIMAD